MSNASTDATGEPANRPEPGQRPNEQDLHVDIVTDAQNDIATSELLEKIRVGVAGRQRFQMIYVRKSGAAGGKTTKSYDPAVDAPLKNGTISILPTKEEIESRTETMRFLVVGLVLAKEPMKYSTQGSGAGRSRQREVDRAARGILPAESNVLRAIVPLADFIAPGSIKYYVACEELHGLCNLRVISSQAIFYFSEIWDGISELINVKERRSQLGAACKKHAARDKRPPQRAVIPISPESTSTPSNSIAITRTANAANLLLMQYSMYSVTKKSSELLALKKTLESLMPDLLSRPTDEGIVAFYEFEDVLLMEDAVKAVDAVQAMYPRMPKLYPELVVQLHAALRRTSLGGKLSYESFVAFLRWGHDRAAAGWDPERLDDVVKAILHDISIADEIKEIATSRTVSKLSDGTTDLTPLLSGLRVALIEIVEFFKAQAKELREQHGGITRHGKIEDLMTKIGDCVDRTALKALEEQVFAIHAEQLASANSNGVTYLEECIGLIEQAINLASA